jgi:L-aminopeptidase/D-esterase-like protein
MIEISLSEIKGFLVGHSENEEYKTGITAILTPEGAIASCYTPGFAPGSRETELLRPEGLVEQIHGITLSGGSAVGLSTATGVFNFLRNGGYGFPLEGVKIPLVTGAVIFDYPHNLSKGLFPDEHMGFQAAENASKHPLQSGAIGVGVSARCGKIGGPIFSSPSGIGSFGLRLDSGLEIASIAVVNSLGSIVDPENGKIISGVKGENGTFLTRDEIISLLAKITQVQGESSSQNTVLVVLGTNAKINKLDAYRLARMVGVGIGRSVYPAHLLFDGDTVFTASSLTGPQVDISYLGALGAEIVSKAIVRSVTMTRNNK